jgi:hypothetical protein
MRGVLITAFVVALAMPGPIDVEQCTHEARLMTGRTLSGPGTPASGAAGAAGATGNTGTLSGGSTVDDGQTGGMAMPDLNDPAYRQAYRDCLARRGVSP